MSPAVHRKWRVLDYLSEDRMLHRCAIVALACLVSACGAVIDPASLKRVALGNSVELPSGYAYISPPAGLYSNQFKYELIPGSYAAEFEDDEGTYFRGPAGCVGRSIAASTLKEQPLNQVTRAEGGVFVPKDSATRARIYFYRWVPAQTSLSATTTTETAIAQQAAPNASVGQSALGVAIAGSIVDAVIESERGKIGFLPGANDDSLRKAVVFRKQ